MSVAPRNLFQLICFCVNNDNNTTRERERDKKENRKQKAERQAKIKRGKNDNQELNILNIFKTDREYIGIFQCVKIILRT